MSRCLSGKAVPSGHNIARLTAYVAHTAPGFTMFDWDTDAGALAARLGIVEPLRSNSPAVVADLPAFAALPAFAPSRHETAARGVRYCGLWESIMPTVGRPDAFHREHTVIRQQGRWLAGEAIGVSYRWGLNGFMANGQLILWMSDATDFVFRQFNRADEPKADEVDGLMLAAASLPHQAPTACRVIMTRLTPTDADEAAIEAALDARAAERCMLTSANLPSGLEAALLPDCGPTTVSKGGDRLLRADTMQSLVRTRWF